MSTDSDVHTDTQLTRGADGILTGVLSTSDVTGVVLKKHSIS